MSKLNMCPIYREIASAKQEKIDKNHQLTSDFCNIEMSKIKRYQQGFVSKSSKQKDGKKHHENQAGNDIPDIVPPLPYRICKGWMMLRIFHGCFNKGTFDLIVKIILQTFLKTCKPSLVCFFHL